MSTAPSILLLHGAGGGGWEWHIWEDVLREDGWHCRALSLDPVAGDPALTKLDDYRAQVLSAAASAGELPPVLIGASLGGLIALACATATRSPSLVIVNGLPPAGVPGWPPYPRSFPEVVAWSESAAVDDYLAEMPDALPEPVFGPGRRWRDESGAVLREAWAGLHVTVPKVPILVLSGLADRALAPRLSLSLAGFLEADLVALAGVSHVGALLGSRAREAAALTTAWLRLALGPGRLA